MRIFAIILVLITSAGFGVFADGPVKAINADESGVALNRDRFAQTPEAYAPQFGGYCAWAVSRNYTADIDPDAFDIVNGKLYLNYSKLVQLRWKLSREEHIRKAEQNWPRLVR